MSFTIIIPARYKASRFPGKLLANLAKKTVLEHTWLSACESDADQIVIAADDQHIAKAANEFGAQVCMTDQSLASGTDRVYQAAKIIGCNDNRIIINLQGDEPCFHKEDINKLANALLTSSQISMASMMCKFDGDGDIDNPNKVKVVIDKFDNALYFSRSVIPFCRQAGSHFHHLGIYAYRMHFLRQFVAWQPTELEKTEQLEQLRAIVNGTKIHMVKSFQRHVSGVDTPDDLVMLEKHMHKSN